MAEEPEYEKTHHNQYEYERTRPMAWMLFAAAGLFAGRGTTTVVEQADKVLDHWEKRFFPEAD